MSEHHPTNRELEHVSNIQAQHFGYGGRSDQLIVFAPPLSVVWYHE